MYDRTPSLRDRRIYAADLWSRELRGLWPARPVGTAFYPVLVHRPAVSLHASSRHSVNLMQLRFASLAMTSL